MTKMAAMPIFMYDENPIKSLFPGTSGTISTKLGIQHQGLRPIIICKSYYPGFTLTYFWQGQSLHFRLLYRKM